MKRNWTERSKLREAIIDAGCEATRKALGCYDRGYRGWNDSSDMIWLIERLEEEVAELKIAYGHGEWDGVMDEALDVINFGAFLRHCAKERLQLAPKEDSND